MITVTSGPLSLVSHNSALYSTKFPSPLAKIHANLLCPARLTSFHCSFRSERTPGNCTYLQCFCHPPLSSANSHSSLPISQRDDHQASLRFFPTISLVRFPALLRTFPSLLRTFPSTTLIHHRRNRSSSRTPFLSYFRAFASSRRPSPIES